MYSPGFYRIEDQRTVDELIDSESFAVMLTPALPEPITSHLPLPLDRSDATKPVLLSHMARANPHWKAFAQSPQAMLIYQGPHAYVSPAWYEPKPDNVPTWNYAVVHVRGTARVIDDPARAFDVMENLVSSFETKYQTGWKLSKNQGVDDLMRAIVVFEIVDLKFEAKFKLSQKHSDVNRKTVIAELAKRGLTALSRYMQRTFEK
jgi:transcriptional regulator